MFSLFVFRIKIFEVDLVGESSLKNILSLDGHISSVKSITTFPTSNENETFIISVGGRAQLKIWNAIMNPDSLIFVSQMQSNMLKGNDKRRKKTWKDQVTALIRTALEILFHKLFNCRY